MKKILVALAAAVTVGAGASGQQATFRSGVNMVRVDAAVLRGRVPVAGLDARNFRVVDNGVAQTIDRLEGTQLPLDVSLVADVSASVRGYALEQLKKAAGQLLDALTDRDRFALVAFSQQVLVPQPLTGDRLAVRAALESLDADGTTALYDATYVALRGRTSSDDTRSVAVVLTDGGDNSSWLTARRVLQSVERSDTIVYGVALEADGGAFRQSFGTFDNSWVSVPSLTSLRRFKFLRDAAEASGGRVFDSKWSGLDRTLADVLSDIRARYVFAYYPTNNSPGWHKLDVQLAGARGQVIARRGYWVGRAN